MSTAAQILANRQNAQKSTGPKSVEGKAIVAKNAIKHGLFAIEEVIKGEKQADFDLFSEKMLEELHPAGAVESMLAERIISLSWRLNRIIRIQNQTFDVMIERDEPSPYQKQLNSMLPRGMRDDPRGAGPGLVLGRAAINDMSNSRVLERLLMYERRIENSLYKTMEEFRKQKIMQELENANNAIESADYDTIVPVLEDVTTTPIQKNAKQSQLRQSQNNITSFIKVDYNNNSDPASDENKANLSEIH